MIKVELNKSHLNQLNLYGRTLITQYEDQLSGEPVKVVYEVFLAVKIRQGKPL